MPSTYTGSGIELIGDGEQSGSWGNTTNLNLQIINRLVSEAGVISLAGTTHTLTIADGTLSDGQYAVLVFGGSPSGTNTVTLSPNDAKRVFVVKNSSGQSVTLTQGSGGNVTVGDGKTAIVYSDGAGAGAAVVNVSEDFVSATLSAIGALTPTDGNFIVGNGSTWVTETGDTVLQSIGVTATAAELNILAGVTATTAELNILAGVTATTAEINILDGVTATAAELNVLDGISGIASQAEAEAGAATDKLMNPLRTAQAISALAPAFTIADGSITTAKLADSSVTTAKIANGNVTIGKLSIGTRSFSGYLSEGDSTTVSYTDNYAFAPRFTEGDVIVTLGLNIYRIQMTGSSGGYALSWRYLSA